MAARIPEEASKKGMCMQDCSLAFCSTSLGSAVPFCVLSRHPIADLSFWVKTILQKQAKVYQTGRRIRINMPISIELKGFWSVLHCHVQA